MQFMTITETDSVLDAAADRFDAHVSRAIEDGWKPIGGVSICHEKLDSDVYQPGVFGYYALAIGMVRDDD